MTTIGRLVQRIARLAALGLVALLVATHGAPTLSLASVSSCRCVQMDHCEKAKHSADHGERERLPCHSRPAGCELHASDCSAAHGFAFAGSARDLFPVSPIVSVTNDDECTVVVLASPRLEAPASPPPDPPPTRRFA